MCQSCAAELQCSTGLQLCRVPLGHLFEVQPLQDAATAQPTGENCTVYMCAAPAAHRHPLRRVRLTHSALRMLG